MILIMKLKVKTSKLNIFFITLFFLLVFFLFIECLAPRGTWTCQKNYSNKKLVNLFRPDCLTEPSPNDRYEYGLNGELRILADPLYLSIFSPRAFQKIDLEIIYRPHLTDKQAIFEAGFLADSKLWRYQLKPVYNYLLEESFDTWSTIGSSDLSLRQKEQKFTSLAEFIMALKQNDQKLCELDDCLALYNINDDIIPAKQLGNILESNQINLAYALRGSHQFYIYLAHGFLDLKGSFMDLNENKDLDDFELIVLKDKQVVASLKIEDLRAEKELSSEESEEITFSLRQENLATGLYKLELRNNDDIVIMDLGVNSSYLSVINKMWPFTDEQVKVYTDSNYLQVKALSPLDLQTIRFDGIDVELSEIYKQYEIEAGLGSIKEIKLERGGPILANDGIFSFSDLGLLNPSYLRLDRFSLKDDRIDYILASYEDAEPLGDGWYRSNLSFKTSDLYRENNQYNLILSVPGLRLFDNEEVFIELKKIKIKYAGPSLLEKIKSMIFSLKK